jgi:hypothetical protein
MLRLSANDANRFSKAWQTAQQLSAGINSRQDAMSVLNNNNIGSDILSKVSAYANNPIAGMIAKAAGVDIAGVRHLLNDLQGMPEQQQCTSSMADKLRNGLQQFNGRN